MIANKITIAAARANPASAPIITFLFILGLTGDDGTSASSMILGGATSIFSFIYCAETTAIVSAIFFAVSGSELLAVTSIICFPSGLVIVILPLSW